MVVYHWLVKYGLWSDVVLAAAGVTVTAALTKLWTVLTGVHPIKLFEEHVHNQKQIAKALDTKTPGGLTDVVNALKEEKEC